MVGYWEGGESLMDLEFQFGEGCEKNVVIGYGQRFRKCYYILYLKMVTLSIYNLCILL